MKKGDIVQIRGKTLKGKNRINRADSNEFEVMVSCPGKIFVMSRAVGARESFWIDLADDQHVEIV